MRDLRKFEEEIQKILEKFEFNPQLRRKIFSQLMEYATEQDHSSEQQTQKK